MAKKEAKKATPKAPAKAVKASAKAAVKPVAKKPVKAQSKSTTKPGVKSAAVKAPPKAKPEEKSKALSKSEVTKGSIKGTSKQKEEKLEKKAKKELVEVEVQPKKGKPSTLSGVSGETPPVKQKKSASSAEDEGSSKAEVRKLKKIEIVAGQEEAKWKELRDKYKGIKAVSYRMSDSFEEKVPLDHKVLGWGFILSVVNDRLEVLFESGIKHLISNYKAK